MRLKELLRQKVLPIMTGRLIKIIGKLLFLTYRIEIQGLDHILDQGKKGSFILGLWHEYIPIVPEFLYRYANFFQYKALVSNSRDGQILATITNSYKRGEAIRVKHTAKGAALKRVIDTLTQNRTILVMTPDGPRGPKRQLKEGIVKAAHTAKCPVVPLTWRASDVWRLKTWDAMQIPKPFTKIYITIKEPFYFKEANQTEIQRLTTHMHL